MSETREPPPFEDDKDDDDLFADASNEVFRVYDKDMAISLNNPRLRNGPPSLDSTVTSVCIALSPCRGLF